MLKARYTFCWLVIIAVFVGTIVTVAKASIDPLDHIIFRHYPGSGVVVAGKTLDGSGNRAAGVPVSVTAYPLDGGPASSYSAVSGPRGNYGLFVPPGSSRLLVVSSPGEAVKIKELVRPTPWLTIKARGHGRMLFTGGVAIGRYDPAPLVLLQARPLNSFSAPWGTFGAANPSPRSHLYRFAYHAMGQLVGHAFLFRAITRQDTAWLPGYGTAKEATIR